MEVIENQHNHNLEAFSEQSQIMLPRLSFDMKVFSWYMIISGIISCFSIIGAIIGIPYIIAGLRLKDGADSLKSFSSTGDMHTLQSSFEHQAKFYKIMKIIIIVSLAMVIIGIVAFVMFLGVIMDKFNQSSMWFWLN